MHLCCRNFLPAADVPETWERYAASGRIAVEHDPQQAELLAASRSLPAAQLATSAPGVAAPVAVPVLSGAIVPPVSSSNVAATATVAKAGVPVALPVAAPVPSALKAAQRTEPAAAAASTSDNRASSDAASNIAPASAVAQEPVPVALSGRGAVS